MSASKHQFYFSTPLAVAALVLGGITAAQGEDWRNTPPYEPYDETVTVRLVKGGQEGASLLPEGETIEDNRALQYIEDTLNINVVYNWLAPSDSYNDKLNLTIASGDIPDMMIVNPLQLQQLTVAGAIEDMTPYIDTYANSDLKRAYDETGGSALEAATIDGKVMGVPNVSPQADAPGMAWVRKDWLDKLGLKAPKTVDDIEAIARAFIEQDPDGDGAADTVGLTGTLQPVAVASNLHGFDAIFNAYGAFPTRFYENDQGQVVYGSVQPETKEALARLAQMYEDGLIDPEFATKNAEKANELVVSGRSGIMFGPWWIPWYPLSDALTNDPTANWQPYLIQNETGEYTYSMNDYTSTFIVVKKGFSNPEIALKIMNIENDFSYGLHDAPQYYPNFNEIWSTLFPIPFLIEQPYVVESLGQRYNQALSGDINPASFTEALKAEFKQVQTDVDAPRSDPSSWATRMARLDAALLLDAADYGEVRSVPAVARVLPVDIAWPALEKMEEETFLQIITGALPIDAFDTFTQQWYASGGTALLDKLNQP